jgi:hypothetical protein
LRIGSVSRAAGDEMDSCGVHQLRSFGMQTTRASG